VIADAGAIGQAVRVKGSKINITYCKIYYTFQTHEGTSMKRRTVQRFMGFLLIATLLLLPSPLPDSGCEVIRYSHPLSRKPEVREMA
jgi:hypothetical protein